MKILGVTDEVMDHIRKEVGMCLIGLSKIKRTTYPVPVYKIVHLVGDEMFPLFDEQFAKGVVLKAKGSFHIGKGFSSFMKLKDATKYLDDIRMWSMDHYSETLVIVHAVLPTGTDYVEGEIPDDLLGDGLRTVSSNMIFISNQSNGTEKGV